MARGRNINHSKLSMYTAEEKYREVLRLSDETIKAINLNAELLAYEFGKQLGHVARNFELFVLDDNTRETYTSVTDMHEKIVQWLVWIEQEHSPETCPHCVQN